MATTRFPRVFGALVLATAGVTLAACGSGSTDSSGGAATHTAAGTSNGPVAVHLRGSAGTVLTDRAGNTLYTPDQEKDGTIRCATACAAVWPPLTVSANAAAPTSVSGVDGTFAVLTRSDGARQLTYDGAPLYTFSLDKAQGQVSGDGVRDSFAGTAFTWHAVHPSGAAAPSRSGSGGHQDPYGY